MRLVPLALIALLAACSGTPSTSGTDSAPGTTPVWSTQDTDTTSTTSTTDPTDPTGTTAPPTGEYFGTVPRNPLPLPTFASVTNYDGTARAQADLVGHPTVMWFYPAAGTGG
jgi:hypothetical protein